MQGSKKPSLSEIEAMSRKVAREIVEECGLPYEIEEWIAMQIMRASCRLFDVYFEEIGYEEKV